jgi:hypothetical protein
MINYAVPLLARRAIPSMQSIPVDPPAGGNKYLGDLEYPALSPAIDEGICGIVEDRQGTLLLGGHHQWADVSVLDFRIDLHTL